MSRARWALTTSVVCIVATTCFVPAVSASSGSSRRATAPVVSEAGQIAFGRYAKSGWFDQSLIVQNANGTNRRVVERSDNGNLSGVRFSPDGKWLAAVSLYRLRVRKVDSKDTGEPVTWPDGQIVNDVADVSWSPDGTQLAFTTYDWESGGRVVAVADVGTLVATVVSDDQPSAYGVEWSPSGRWLAVSRASEVFGCIRSDGPSYYSEIVQMRPDGTDVTTLTDDVPWDWHMTDWGPRGILGFTYETGDDGDISEPCPEGNLTRNVLFQPRHGQAEILRDFIDAYAGAFSPDGLSYLLSELSWPNRIWRVDLDGEEQRTLLTRRGLGSDWGNLPTS